MNDDNMLDITLKDRFKDSNFLVYSSDLGVLSTHNLDGSISHLGTSLEEIFDSDSFNKSNFAVIFIERKTFFINIENLLKIDERDGEYVLYFTFQNQTVKYPFFGMRWLGVELIKKIKEKASDELKLMMELEGI